MKKRIPLIFHNWGVKIASLLLALLLWFASEQINDPIESGSFNTKVTFTNEQVLLNNNKVYKVLDNTDSVRVTVRGPASVIKNLSASDIVAEADIEQLSENGTIQIEYRLATGDSYDSITGNREVVKLSIEDKQSKYVRIGITETGTVASGYQIGNIIPDQNMIEISGPASQVDQVDKAGISIDVSGASSSLSLNVEVDLYDKDGNLLNLPNITKQTNYVHVSVEVLGTKTVPLAINYAGTPADGYLATGEITIDPTEVLVAGSTSTLAGLSKISVSEPISISGASETVVVTINLNGYLPSGLKLADSDFDGVITVTVPIEKEASKRITLIPSNFELINIPENLGVTLEIAESEDDPREATILGLKSEIDTILPADVHGVIDVGAYLKQFGDVKLEAFKAYYLPITLESPEGIRLKGAASLRVVTNKE